MNRTSFKSFTRAGISMTTIALSIASALSLTGCGSTGGSLSKAADSGAASGGTHNSGTSATTGSGSGSGSGSALGSSASTTPTNTATTPSAPSARQASNTAWDGVVSGGGDIVMQAGETVAALGSRLKMPNSPLADNPVSAILTGTGGAIYGIGAGLITGIEGTNGNGNPIDGLSPSLLSASAQFGKDVSDVGRSIGASGAGAPYAATLSPTVLALGSNASNAGSNFSMLQFQAGSVLTDDTIQQVTSALRPIIYPVTNGAVEIVSAVGDRTGLGTPLDTLITKLGDGVAAAGTQIGLAYSSPVLAGIGGTINATGKTVTAVGALANDGQSTSIVPITATGNAGTSVLQGGMGSASLLPGGSTLSATLSSSKLSVMPITSGALSGAGAASAPLESLASQGSVVISTTSNAVAAPVVTISSTLYGPVSSIVASPQSLPLPLLTPVAAPIKPLVSGAVAALKGDSLAPALPGLLAHPLH